MADGKHDAPYVLPTECYLKHKGIEEDVLGNKKTIDKLIKVIYGNGEDGLLWKINTLMLRNIWIDKGASILVGVAASVSASLLTLYFTGAFN